MAEDIKEKLRQFLSNHESDNHYYLVYGSISFLALRRYLEFSVFINQSLSLNVAPITLYEAILQCYLFLGFPRAIEGLKRLSAIFKKHRINLDLPLKDDQRDYQSDGHALCKKVYGMKYDKLLNLMNSYSPDLSAWMIEEGYGKVLSRPGLTLEERELVTVSALISENVPNQLRAHIRGALNAGAKIKKIESIIEFLGIWVEPGSIKEAKEILNCIK
ncbi:MAG: carboxymuconolactone decarboxylase family protein [candidate division Zixibacteria bacterium]|nr:carboxymuconolactone decarboxylase family protein [candidate division Zixibacteria bacterium]